MEFYVYVILMKIYKDRSKKKTRVTLSPNRDEM